MKYCCSCGAALPDTAAFCSACGTPVEAEAAPAVTPVVTDAPKPRRNVKSMVFHKFRVRCKRQGVPS